MIVPDVNLLIYAYNLDSPKFELASQCWQDLLSGDEPIGLSKLVLLGFLRVSISTRAYPIPLTIDEAETHIHRWLERAVTRVVDEGPDHLDQVITLLKAAGSAGGNLVIDAQIAAIAKSHNATIHTSDQDFRRFPGVKVHYPLEEDR